MAGSRASAQLQIDGSNIIEFKDFEGMATQYDRHALPDNKLNWCENLQPIGKNELLAVGIPASTLTTLAGETITRQFSESVNGINYLICFTVSGAAYAVNLSNGVQTKFANAGTFSLKPDVTDWNGQLILITDATAGYSAWNGTTFIRQGGVSPNIKITAIGTGYTSAPTVTISGGSGSGATATATVAIGVVTSITLTNPGTGYQASDTLTVTISGGGGTGATATAEVWPFLSPNNTTIAIFQGRVFLAQQKTLTYSGTKGYDDFNPANASGTFTISDTDLINSITALRSLNNYLYILGDNSVKQIGNLTVSNSITQFTVVTLSSDQGTTFQSSIISYNRLLLFANTVGVYAVYGSSVEKISNDMDGVFRLVDFTQEPVSAVNDINNIHTFMILVKYKDPMSSTRSILLSFLDKKWFVISQGNNLKYVVTAVINGVTETFGTSGNDVTQILEDYVSPVPFLVRTPLSAHNKPFLGKTAWAYAVAQTVNVSVSSPITLTIESERGGIPLNYTPSGGLLQFVGTGEIQFINNSSQPINFVSSNGFFYQTSQSTKVNVGGVYLGATLQGTAASFSLNTIILGYYDGALFGSAR